MLSMSGKANGLDANLTAAADATGEKLDEDDGIPNGRTLRKFALAMVTGEELEAARSELLDELGPEALVDSAAIVANFEAINRVADATGTKLDDMMDRALSGPLAGLGLEKMKSE